MNSINLIVALLCFVSNTITAYKYFQSKQLKAGESLNIWPITNECNTETHWNLEACDGCKIVLACVQLSRSCAGHMTTVYDGKWTTRHCGPSDTYLLKTSQKNWMNIIIENQGTKPGSYCHVTVTNPYYNSKFDQIDSSEHGLGTGARSQTSCSCGWANKSPGRIVGGHETVPNEYPFAALLMVKSRGHPYCSGSVISPQHILTAAHCTQPFHGVKISVVLGEHDITTKHDTSFTQVFDVETVYEHPNYDKDTNLNDIAILKLKKKIKFNEAIGPVCLPQGPNIELENEYVKVLGWGNTKYNGPPSPVLRKVNLKVIGLDICKTIYGSVDIRNRSQICTWAPNKGACQGDSGGALVWRNPDTNLFTQVGLYHSLESVDTPIRQ